LQKIKYSDTAEVGTSAFRGPRNARNLQHSWTIQNLF